MCIYQKFWKNVTLLILIQIHTERAINYQMLQKMINKKVRYAIFTFKIANYSKKI
jgi:hypothetical protein